ncbi:LrgB family protein [Paenibacillus aurantius]|uniref:LrgB family protein n=1 Tax=Paenibacillus aurantius TaxID=2918900 RepID=A0AA96RGK1_9BACL|nr:LrgB family protein [Paenibacillus aurantius]WNQ13122.1 LrgB family protein [Paenibacillus aurantius]
MTILIPILSLIVTVGVYLLSKKMYRRWKWFVFSPLLVSPVVLIGCLLATRTSYDAYASGTHVLLDLLKPATVAFAIPIYKHLPLLRKHAAELIVSVMLGSLLAFASSILIARLFGLELSMLANLAPRSVTTPIAMAITEKIGGIASLTAACVIVTAILGMFLGPLLIRLLSIQTPIAKGVMLGMGAHGGGTSKAFEFGPVEGTVSCLSMIAAAVVSLAFAPLTFPLLMNVLR